MTYEDVLKLAEGDTVSLYHKRGRVTQALGNFVRIDWVHGREKTCYDILRRTSPLWSVIELES